MTTTDFLVTSAKCVGNQLTCFIYLPNSMNIGELVFIRVGGLTTIVGTINPGAPGAQVARTIYLDSADFNRLCGYQAPYVLAITYDANYAVRTITSPTLDTAQIPHKAQALLRSAERSIAELTEEAFKTPAERVILAAQLLKIVLPGPVPEAGYAQYEGKGAQPNLA